jgi:hypothetical protein
VNPTHLLLIVSIFVVFPIQASENPCESQERTFKQTAADVLNKDDVVKADDFANAEMVPTIAGDVVIVLSGKSSGSGKRIEAIGQCDPKSVRYVFRQGLTGG